ncbi:hypothetical protein MGN01_22870 [Methylobacterium gnaphalii]|uniref:Uncharacterized protein n=1 Tax=Methylobacterium gnaphalii TaxID=1010610 RepID=A0A512JKN4_9HYPH|nr:hypothetical protein MGN01_22870 [Methylobacterium gnaphalii]GLS47779.1 hypothetical protein GCM10007885_06230 [Methylobacterium gnaphalii]
MAPGQRAGSEYDPVAPLDHDAVAHANRLDPLCRDVASPGQGLQDFVRFEHKGRLRRDVSASTLPLIPELG